MYSKFKYIILTLLLLGIGFGIFSYLKLGPDFLYLFDLPLILVGITIIFFSLPRDLKMKSRVLTYSILGITIINLILCVNATVTYFSDIQQWEILDEYRELTCEEMENRFHMDKKKNELRFFHFNLFYTDSLKKELKKYGVTYYGMGSLYQENLNCYNKFVADYLKENIELKNLVK